MASPWRDCHSADALSPSLLIHRLKGEGVQQQNDSLVRRTDRVDDDEEGDKCTGEHLAAARSTQPRQCSGRSFQYICSRTEGAADKSAA